MRAHRTINRLIAASYEMDVRDMGGTPVWGGLVEGKRCLAVTTAALGVTDERYQAAWERMLDGD